MIEVEVDLDVSDNIDPAPDVNLISVTSSDGENEYGDGNHSPDIVVEDNGRIYVRAERAGPKEDRTYTIRYKATDASGNSAFAETQVIVLHDKR